MLSDFRFSLRLLAKSPTFTLVAVATLAIGIGAATIVFSAVNGLFLKPLPLIQNPERLFFFSQTGARWADTTIGVNYADFRDLRARLTTVDGMWIFGDRTVIVDGAEQPERLVGTEISSDAFRLLGVTPVVGRNFLPSEELPGAPEVALLGYDLWQRRFGGSADVVGTRINLNGQPTLLVGVMPKGWGYPSSSEVWTPLRPEAEHSNVRGSYYYLGHAKIKAGVTLRQVQAEADAVMMSLAAEYNVSNKGVGVRFIPLREEATHDSAQLVKLLFGAVLFVFLIACLNVANLLLARGISRSKEVAVRLALGAKRSQLLRQFLAESVVLGLLGGVGGIVLALWGVDLLKNAIPVETPFWMHFGVDSTVLSFTLGLSMLGAVLFGLVPAIKSTRPSLLSQLKEGGRVGGDQGANTHRVRNILVVAEVAIALVLLLGATLLLRSFINLRSVNSGFDRNNVLTFRTGFPVTMVGHDEDIPVRFFRDVEARLKFLPGVISAGVTNYNFGAHGDETMAYAVEGSSEPRDYADASVAALQAASPGYFETLKIRLVAGRMLADTDASGSSEAALVDSTFARREFGGTVQAVGHRVRLLEKPGDTKPWIEIIGVVDAVVMKPDAKEQRPVLYRHIARQKTNFSSVVLRTVGEPTAYVPAVRSEVLTVNRSIPIYNVFTLDQSLVRQVWAQRLFSYFFALSGGIALFLSCIGLYGVMNYNVSQRQQELGMRMALGAAPQEVVQMVLKRGLVLVTTGLGIGIVTALFLVPLLSDTLYGISPHDPPTFAFVPLLLVAVALLACYLPSRRITRTDPNASLRYE